jgi:predicted GNAT family acetyltransferase
MIADHPDRHRYILDVDGHQAAEVVYRMIPTCDYLQGWLRKHPDYSDLVETQA